jgi:hypothetical protein
VAIARALSRRALESGGIIAHVNRGSGPIQKIAMLGNHLPRQCGIATFTTDRWWDANKVGLSPPLIETERGWLMLYHGVRQTAAGCL